MQGGDMEQSRARASHSHCKSGRDEVRGGERGSEENEQENEKEKKDTPMHIIPIYIGKLEEEDVETRRPWRREEKRDANNQKKIERERGRLCV